MDDDPSAVRTRLDRIVALDRRGSDPRELLAELRGLLGEAEAQARGDRKAEEVMGRRGKPMHGT